MLWLVFGRTRITLRVLPLIGFCGFVAALLALVFRHQPTTAWFALASTFIPVVVLSVWLVTIRLLNWKILVGEPTAKTREQTRFPLRDLFWITLLVSVGFAALRLIRSEADVLLDLHLLNWPLLISQLVGLAAIVGALRRQRWIFLCCAAAVIFALLYLIAEPLARFASDRLYDIYPFLWTNVPARILTSYPVSLFVLLLPYRLRGWRLQYKRMM